MFRTLAYTILTCLSSCLMAADASLQNGLIAHWDFNETGGIIARDSSPSQLHARLINAHRATGTFGTALRLTGQQSYAIFTPPSQLKNSDQMSFAAWVLWEGTGQYPNLIHCGWNPGGFMFFVNKNALMFRMGKPGKRPLDVQTEWQEACAMALTKLPMKTWTHVAATFKRPNLTVYVNGKPTGRAHWDFPVDFNTPTATLGMWNHYKTSHEGLMDDIRLYNRQLSQAEITQLANPQNRTNPAYKDLPDQLSSQTLITAQNNHATLSIAANGNAASLKLKASGRELLKMPRPLVLITRTHGLQNEPPCFLEMEGEDIIRCRFFNPEDVVRLKLVTTPSYFKLVPLEIKVKDLESIVFCQLNPVMKTYRGHMLGMLSDDQDALCLRSLGLHSTVAITGVSPTLVARAETAQADPVAIAAAPRAEIQTILKDIQTAEPVPKSSRGGAWTLDSEATRASYLFANLRARDTDAWIDLARRGGFQVIHYHAWWSSLGHYSINTGFFPKGLEDMKKASAKIHAAGLQNTFHTLTACISTGDPWVTPIPHQDLLPFTTYTLTKPMTDKDTTIFVNEVPIDKHDRVFTYSGNGNAIRIGNEIILYDDISRKQPYAFLNCTRGAFNTKPQPHPKNAKADYLQQRYLAFYPQPDSKLADQLSQAIADKFNALNLDGLYFDGSEGMMSRYGVDAMRWNIFKRLKGAATTEASTWGHNNWWFHTRLGAWDYPCWSYRTNVDSHVSHAKDFPKSDLLRPQMGWWTPKAASPTSRVQFSDECEYFAAKNHGIDGAMSLSGLYPGSENERVLAQLTTLGWHERARLAHYFTQADRDQLARPNHDVILRQDEQGHWRLLPQFLSRRRLVSLKPGEAVWQVRNPHRGQPLRLRLEALCVPNVKHPAAHTILAVTDPKNLTVRGSAQGVRLTTQCLPSTSEAPFPKLKLTASNSRKTPRGAWIQAGNTYDFPYHDLKGCNTFGFWVKGDNSGAVLNLQFKTPPVYSSAISDHYVKLDFNGWKYVTLLLRERDADQMLDYAWPYSTNPAAHATTRNSIKTEYIEAITLFLNNVPAQGNTTVEIGDIHGFPQTTAKLIQPSLTLNGQTITFPVTLDSNDYLELDEHGQAEHFDHNGTLKARFIPQMEKQPVLKRGLNSLTLTATEEDLPPRAEVTCFAVGKPFGTRSQNVAWNYLDREYEIPRTILRLDGVDNQWTITRRDEEGQAPNDKPTLDVTLKVLDAGSPAAETPSHLKTAIDTFRDTDCYKLSKTNQYSKYAYDADGAGTAKAGVTFSLEKATSELSADGALTFSATSNRNDNSGWAAVGRRFPRPLNLRKAKALSFKVKGSMGNASLKIQLRDTEGAWHDMVTTSVKDTWQTKTFSLTDANLNLEKIDYLLIFFNGLPARQKVTVTIDQMEAELVNAKLTNPTLTLQGQDITFPCSLENGDELTCRDQKTWTVTTSRGKIKAKGQLKQPFPELKPGANTVKLTFQNHNQKGIRLRASFVKLY